MTDVLIPNGGETSKTNVRVAITLTSALLTGETLQIYRNFVHVGTAASESTLVYVFIDNVYLGGNFNYTAKILQVSGILLDSNKYVIKLAGAVQITHHIDGAGTGYNSYIYALIPGKKYLIKAYYKSLFPLADDVSMSRPVLRYFTAIENFITRTNLLDIGNPGYSDNDYVTYIELWGGSNYDVLEGRSNTVKRLRNSINTGPVILETFAEASEPISTKYPDGITHVLTNIPAGASFGLGVSLARMSLGVQYHSRLTIVKKNTTTNIATSVSSSGVSNGAVTKFITGISFEIPLDIELGQYVASLEVLDSNNNVVLTTENVTITIADPLTINIVTTPIEMLLRWSAEFDTTTPGSTTNLSLTASGLIPNTNYVIKILPVSLTCSTNVYTPTIVNFTTNGTGNDNDAPVPFSIQNNLFTDTVFLTGEVAKQNTTEILYNITSSQFTIIGTGVPPLVTYPVTNLTWSIGSVEITRGLHADTSVTVIGLAPGRKFFFKCTLKDSANTIYFPIEYEAYTANNLGVISFSFDTYFYPNVPLGNFTLDIEAVSGIDGNRSVIYGPTISSVIVTHDNSNDGVTNNFYANIPSNSTPGSEIDANGFVFGLESATDYNFTVKFLSNAVETTLGTYVNTSETDGSCGLFSNWVIPNTAIPGTCYLFVEISNIASNPLFSYVTEQSSVIIAAALALNVALDVAQVTPVNQNDNISFVITGSNFGIDRNYSVHLTKYMSGNGGGSISYNSITTDNNGSFSLPLTTIMSATGFQYGIYEGGVVQFTVEVANDSDAPVLIDKTINVTIGAVLPPVEITFDTSGSLTVLEGEALTFNGVINNLSPNTNYTVVTSSSNEVTLFLLRSLVIPSDSNGTIDFSFNTVVPAGADKTYATYSYLYVSTKVYDETGDTSIIDSNTITYLMRR